VVNQWPGGFQGEVTVKAGTSAINGWTVRWTFANGQVITQLWSGVLTQTGASVTVKNMSYNGSLGANATTVFGFNASWNGTNAVPALTCASP
jgi:cellulase/cellobiase CelA1